LLGNVICHQVTLVVAYIDSKALELTTNS